MIGDMYEKDFKKADIGLFTVQALEQHDLIDEDTFRFLRHNKTCSFQLLKKLDEVKGIEDRYKKYRTHLEPEFSYQGQEYYVARNWGRSNATRFIKEIQAKYPALRFEWSV